MNNSIGFKGTDKEFKCRGFQYSLNKKYIHQGEINLCKSGFHFCRKIKDVFEYYPLAKSRFFIINYNSESYKTDGNKSVTNEIEFIEEITERNILGILEKYNCNNDDFLIFSIRKNYSLEIVKFLVDSGANIQTSNNFALKWSSLNGQLEVVKFLVEKGADVQAGDNYALKYASGKGYLEIVKLLVNSGANMNSKNNYALRWASMNGFLEVVKFLVESKVNLQDDHNSSLKYAFQNGHTEIVNFLIEKGVNIKS